MAANQAAELSEGTVSVVATKSVPQGISAMLAFNPDLDAEANVEAMTTALAGVQAGEITTAVRSTTIDDVSVEKGQAIALLNGKLVAVGTSPNDALNRLFGTRWRWGFLDTLEKVVRFLAQRLILLAWDCV